MSSPLAVAAVTAVLKDLLNNGVIDHNLGAAVDGPVTVTALAPDRIETGAKEKNQLNLFLFQVSPNLGWRNVGLPTRNGAGEPVNNAPLALDLHYLLTAYGEREFNAEILLGYAMQLLHETPVLTRQDIRTALAAPSPVTGTILPTAFATAAAADLADQVEQLKITPQFLNSEELSRLWTAFQGHYRPTMAYQMSVVLIQSRRPTQAPLSVRERKLHVLPFRRPVIENVAPQVVPAGGTVSLRGQNLQAPGVKASFGTVAVAPTEATDQSLVVTLPAGLLAGVNTVQVVQDLDFGTPSEPHRGFQSNVAAFMLAPRITTTPTPPNATIQVTRGNPLTLTLAPPVGRSQLVRLLIGDRAILLPPRAPADPATAASVSFPIPADFPAGTYLLRVQVDGAESGLDVSADVTNPQYTGPKVTILP
jgi:hypothetical protein